jgi:hypothetical protein
LGSPTVLRAAAPAGNDFFSREGGALSGKPSPIFWLFAQPLSPRPRQWLIPQSPQPRSPQPYPLSRSALSSAPLRSAPCCQSCIRSCIQVVPSVSPYLWAFSVLKDTEKEPLISPPPFLVPNKTAYQLLAGTLINTNQH